MSWILLSIHPFPHFSVSRSLFWDLEDMIPFSSHWLYRILWGWMSPPEGALLKRLQGPAIRRTAINVHVVQEAIIPLQCLGDGIHHFNEWFGIYPLRVLPLRVYDRGNASGFLRPQKQLLKQGKDYGIWVDVAAYGTPKMVQTPPPLLS